MTTKNTFENLIQNYNQEQTESNLISLANAVTYSALKKVYCASGNETIAKVRRDIAKANSELKSIQYANTNADDIRLDLVNDAVIAILEQTNRQKEQGQEVDLLAPYEITRLKCKVWIKKEDSVDGWETIETSPIREIFKNVRRAIENNASLDANSKFTYIEDYAENSEHDIGETIYIRLGKYANLGGYVTDANGKNTFYTADNQTVEDIETMINKLELTEKQAKVLNLRLAGYGYKAIATYLGVTQRAVAKTLEAIQKKATANNIINK